MRLLPALFLCSILGFPAAAQPKINADRLLFHVKETFNIPSGVETRLGEPERSEIPGLWKVTLTLSKGGQSQERTLLVAEDGAHYLVAEIQDVTKLPDPDNLARLKLDGAPAKGPKGAKVTVVEFTDYQCPYCKKAHEAIEENLFKTYGDKVRLVFKHYPLTGIHPWAEPAGVAGACVAKLKPEAFWSFTDAVFRDQEGINGAVLNPDRRSVDEAKFKARMAGLAQAAKVDRAKFESCYEKKETLDAVKKDAAEGDALGVSSTPTLFVNGHRMTGFGAFDQLKGLVDEMLAGTHAPAALKD